MLKRCGQFKSSQSISNQLARLQAMRFSQMHCRPRFGQSSVATGAEIDSFMWMAGVKHAKERLRSHIREWIACGIFPPGADEQKLFGSLFIQALPDANWRMN